MNMPTYEIMWAICNVCHTHTLTQYLDGKPAYGEEYHNGGKHFNYLSEGREREREKLGGINHIQPVRGGLIYKLKLGIN